MSVGWKLMRTNKDFSDPRTSFWAAVYGNDPWYNDDSDFDSVSKVETVYDGFGNSIGSRVVSDCVSAPVIERKETRLAGDAKKSSPIKSGRVRMRDCAPTFGKKVVDESLPSVKVMKSNDNLESAEKLVVSVPPLLCGIEMLKEERKEWTSELHPFDLAVGLLGGGREKKKFRRKRREKPKVKRVTCGPGIKSTSKAVDITPPHRFVNLTYNDPSTAISGATPFKIVTYQVTSAYDVSSGILTTAYAGFEEYSQLYDENRVHKTEVIWDVSNNDANINVRVGMIPTAFDANANVVTYQGAIDLMEGPYSTGLVMLGRATGGETVHKFKYTILPQMILGDNIYFTDKNYAGAFNSSPNIMLFLNLVVVSTGSGTNLTNGVFGNLSLRSLIKFYNRRVVLDPGPLTREPYIKPAAKVKVKEKDVSDSESDELVVVSSRKKRDRDKIKLAS